MRQVLGVLGRIMVAVLAAAVTFVLSAAVAGIAFGGGPTWLPPATLVVSVVVGITVSVLTGRRKVAKSGALATDGDVLDALSSQQAPIQALTAPSAPQQAQAKKRWQASPLGVVVGLGLISLGLGSINNGNVERLARQFFEENTAELGGSVTIERVDVPLWAFLMPSYEVTITFHSDAAPADFRILRPRVDGNCLISDCSISIRRGDMLRS